MKPKLNNSERLSKEEKSHRKFLELFPKMKKTKTSSTNTNNIQRFNATANEGLTTTQVEERINQGLVNTTNKKQSKTYPGIIFGNIFTGFNILCAIAAAALILAHAPMSQYLFVIIFLVNTVVAIFLEIRAKQKLDKLSILSSPTAKVMRNGKKTEIAVEELVIDDILLLSAGQQVPADCIAVEGMAELNESLLTGESVPIKKEDGAMLYAGSFVASGRIAVRVDKIGEDTYISKLTSRAKKYKRPNSEIMNSISLFIKVIAFLIVPIAILTFINNYSTIEGAWDNMRANGGFWATLMSNDKDLNKTIQNTASVVIGMIPSGLLLLTTVALSTGMIRLAKYNTLVQDMYSLEMLARVNVLCLDKTGTITDGRMKVSDCILLGSAGSEFGVDDILGSMLASLNDNNQTSIALYERFGHSSALQPIATLP